MPSPDELIACAHEVVNEKHWSRFGNQLRERCAWGHYLRLIKPKVLSRNTRKGVAAVTRIVRFPCHWDDYGRVEECSPNGKSRNVRVPTPNNLPAQALDGRAEHCDY
jgi:hypothetical protein